MIVVADTSVILNLSKIKQERLLQQLFQRVLIPKMVATEFSRLSETKGRFTGLTIPDWIEILPSPESFPDEVSSAWICFKFEGSSRSIGIRGWFLDCLYFAKSGARVGWRKILILCSSIK